ncbi:MAG: C10 family peptidase [Fibromonadaceae bacterium]|jgi:hypothetical protein|nr:C10 family peptidase [Fibromonadaceae bacterium]
MKIRNFICLLFSLAFLFSCSDENLPSDNLSKVEPLAKVQDTNYRIDMAAATNLIEEAITFLDKEHPSESKSSRRVNSVSILRFGEIKSSMMKSGEYRGLDISDTLAYVFNFGDSLGYVIISNDVRVESPLLAFTKKGSLVNGKTDNPGLKIFLERLEGYMLESIAKFGKADDQKEMIIAQRGPYLGPLEIAVEPLVPVEWGQGMPFNDNVGGQCINNTGNNKYLAGCAATATAQIMAHWKYPTSMGNTSYNWALLTKYKHGNDFYPSSTDSPTERILKETARNSVANLFQRIGTGVGMLYGCDVSENPGGVQLALYWLSYNYGFASPDFRPYNSSAIKPTLIVYGYPFVARGCNANSNDPGCHAWVIDGLARIHKPNTFFIHNNWGWNGRDNGYYPIGVFDPLQYNFQDVYMSKAYR